MRLGKWFNLVVLLAAISGFAAEKPDKQKQTPPGIKDRGVQRPIANIHPDAVFPVPGNPDWVLILKDSVWIGNKPTHTVTRLDPKTNTVVATVAVGKLPCSGLAGGFGSVWVPNCGDKTLSRIDLATNKVVATIPLGPANTEGAIAASEDRYLVFNRSEGSLGAN